MHLEPYELHVYVVPKAKDMDKILLDAGKYPDGGADGVLVRPSHKSFLMLFNKEELTQSLIVHEIMHFMLIFMREQTGKSDERYCSIAEFMYEEIVSRLKEYKEEVKE
jgi:hypothetical protein